MYTKKQEDTFNIDQSSMSSIVHANVKMIDGQFFNWVIEKERKQVGRKCQCICYQLIESASVEIKASIVNNALGEKNVSLIHRLSSTRPVLL